LILHSHFANNVIFFVRISIYIILKNFLSYTALTLQIIFIPTLALVRENIITPYCHQVLSFYCQPAFRRVSFPDLAVAFYATLWLALRPLVAF